MKKIIANLFVFLFIALAYSYTRGYIKSNGTYVQPYFRSSPNNYKIDNYSSKGNVNPFTGNKGTKSYFGW